jgi:hypothetical protein
MAKKDKKKELAGLLIPGGVLIGLGVDFLLGTMPAGLLIGLGCGFVAMFIAMVAIKK